MSVGEKDEKEGADVMDALIAAMAVFNFGIAMALLTTMVAFVDRYNKTDMVFNLIMFFAMLFSSAAATYWAIA